MSWSSVRWGEMLSSLGLRIDFKKSILDNARTQLSKLYNIELIISRHCNAENMNNIPLMSPFPEHPSLVFFLTLFCAGWNSCSITIPVSFCILSTCWPYCIALLCLFRVTQLTTDHLPLLSVLYVSPTEIVAAVSITWSVFVSVCMKCVWLVRVCPLQTWVLWDEKIITHCTYLVSRSLI